MQSATARRRSRSSSQARTSPNTSTEQLARIPDLSEALREATPAIKRQVFAGFDLQIAYDKVERRVELSATVSEAVADAFENRESPPSGGLSVVPTDIAGARFVSRYDARIVERTVLQRPQLSSAAVVCTSAGRLLKRQHLHFFLASVALGLSLFLVLPAAAFARARGIDVSRFQGKIDWAQVAETNIEFAFIQGSRGSGGDCAVVPQRCGADEFYERNYRRAGAAGIRVGSYHRAFADGDGMEEAKLDANAEAKLFLEQVGSPRSGDLLPALDVETPFGGLNARQLRAWVWTWLQRVEEKLGVKPLIYTNYSSWQETGDTTAFALAGHRLWIANHGVDEPLVPAEDWGGEAWSIWQFTSSGRVAGIEGSVDKNRLRLGFRKISVP